jgi:cytochrome c-type biogenesis protein CcmH/NrfG
MSASRRIAATAATAGDDRSIEDRRWRLEDQRSFLVRSLADLRSELDVGDIETRDYEALAARDRGRLSSVEAELAQLDAEIAAAEVAASGSGDVEENGSGAPRVHGSSRRRIWLGVLATVALTAGATLLVVHLASPRLPGQPLTGSIKQNLAQQEATQLAEASALVNQGTQASLSGALSVYRDVLSEDPNQPQALAETGWLEWEAGFASSNTKLETEGKALVERSVSVERNDFAAHLFLGTIDLESGKDPSSAVAQYKTFLSEHPPKSEITSAAPLIKRAFLDVGQPVPAAVAG